MLNKKQQEKIQGAPELQKIITEIPITNGRNVEPFVKVFNYSDKNVAKSSLGSLVGVFEVADRNEDSVFIVNFLTSVAKTEYFSNLRRGSIESFEASLHKINLALAELVKDGHIAWLGKFHGAIGVLEKNNLHFSVTGKAQIVLLRNGNLAEISDGLASSESNIHPLKTFVEISSGRLAPHDKIILTSPELFDLLTPEDLEKNALRMDMERFSQFLRTVLVNKLDMGGSLIIDFQEAEPIVPAKKEVKKPAEAPQNFFSQEAFEAAQKEKSAIIVDGLLNNEEAPDPTTEEYIDPRTRHIYVQGDMTQQNEDHPLLENTKLHLQDFLHSLGGVLLAQKKSLRKNGKKLMILWGFLREKLHITTHALAHILYQQGKRGMTALISKIRSARIASLSKKSAEKIQMHKEYMPSPQSGIESPQTPPKEEVFKMISEEQNTDVPPFIREKLVSFYRKREKAPSSILFWENALGIFQKGLAVLSLFIGKVLRTILLLLSASGGYIKPRMNYIFRISFTFLKTQLNRYERKTLVIAFFTFIILVTGITLIAQFFTREEAPPIVTAPIETTTVLALPLETEKNARLAENIRPILTTEDAIVASVLLDDTTYIITSAYILSVNENKKYPLPEGSGSATFATPMDDLRIIFISTDANEFLAFTPSNKKFTKNTLNLPLGTAIRSLGTYLTYLYILDGNTNQVYRFPRAEGGFGTASIWNKEPLTLGDSPRMAVSETIFIAPDTTSISAFFRGTFVKNLESPLEPLSLTYLFTHPDLTRVYALDATHKRVLVWNQEGALLAQYFSEQFSDIQSISVNEKKNEIFLTTSNELFSFTFNLE